MMATFVKLHEAMGGEEILVNLSQANFIRRSAPIRDERTATEINFGADLSIYVREEIFDVMDAKISHA